MYNMLDEDRVLAAAAAIAAAILLVVPRDAQGKALAVVATLATLAWLSFRGTTGSGTGPSEAPQAPAAPRAFAPIDPELYTLRVRVPGGAGDFPRRHLASRKKLAAIVRRAARLGSRNGNSASGEKAECALEDFFARYHRAMLSADPEFAARTLAVLRDTRAIALNALAELTLAVPTSISDRAMLAIDVARDETLRCMSTLAARHAASGSPALNAAAASWRSPTPHDPARLVARPSALF